MRKLLISLGVVAVVFFAQASSVVAKICDQKAEVWCENANDRVSDNAGARCCKSVESTLFSSDHVLIIYHHCTRLCGLSED